MTFGDAAAIAQIATARIELMVDTMWSKFLERFGEEHHHD